MKHAWCLSLLVCPVVAGAVVFGGCGGDDSTTFAGTDSAAPDVTVPDTGTVGDDAGTNDSAPIGDAATDTSSDVTVGCPTYTGTDAYCLALLAYCNRCSASFGACDVTNFEQCENVSALFSVDGRKAIDDCLGNATCDRDSGAIARQKCIDDKLAVATPGPEQAKLAQDFCSECPGDLADAGDGGCAAEFFALPDGGPGKGIELMEFNGTIAKGIDDNCIPLITPDGGDAGPIPCGTKFNACALVVLGKVAPADACKDGG